MERVLERQVTENVEKQRHNAMISERYRRILDAVEEQQAQPVSADFSSVSTQETPVAYEERTREQAPTVTTYAPSRLASAVFTAEKFERAKEYELSRADQAPQAAAASVTAVKASTAASVEYVLTPLAKIAMAVVALLVVAMLTLIGMNSQIIYKKSIRLKNLEEQKQELTERNEEIQRYLQELQTEENIMRRAAEAGLLD